MGLSIYYHLSAPNTLPVRTLRGWLEQTRAFALELGCKEVGPVQKVGPEFGWGQQMLTDPTKTGIESMVDLVRQKGGYILEIWPGDGCECAFLGLCRFAADPSLWPSLSPEFARGLGVQRLARPNTPMSTAGNISCGAIKRSSACSSLQQLGMGVNVSDESEYWETRSEEKLRAAVGCYDRFMASLAGACKDAAAEAAPKLTVEAPISRGRTLRNWKRKAGRRLSGKFPKTVSLPLSRNAPNRVGIG